MSEDKKAAPQDDTVKTGSNPETETVVETEDITLEPVKDDFDERNQIDEFTKALLDQKRDLNLFSDDVTSEDIDNMMNSQQRRNAEQSMSHALDALRKERGQQSIEEEEENFAWDQLAAPVLVEDDDEPVTTESVVGRKKSASSAKKVLQDHTYEGSKKQKKPAKKEKTKEDYIERKEKRPKRKVKKKSVAILVVIGVIIAALFGGYAWKVLVYDKQYSMTAAQQSSYDKLVNYADEFNMSSDAEKSEILSLESDYNNLPEKKKVEIDAYFKEHTGSDFQQLLQTYKDQHEQSQKDSAYNAFLAQAQNFATLDEAGQQDFMSKRELFDSLTPEQQDAINQALASQGQPDYNTLVPASQQPAEPEQPSQDDPNQQAPVETPDQDLTQQPEDHSAEIAEYQNAISSLSSDRQAYLEFITAEGQDPSTDEILAQYDRDIAYYQSLIDALS